VTLLPDLGVPPYVVKAIVGHGDIELTKTISAHAVLDEQRKASTSSAPARRRGDRDMWCQT
jgi:hypothetical protein